MSDLKNQLDEIVAAIANLRAAPSGGPETRKLLDSLFRRVHNLKAQTAADGLAELSNTAHEIESVLYALRTGNATLNEQAIQQLSESTTSISEQLLTSAIPSELWNALKAEEKHAVKQTLREGADLFLVEASFDVADFDSQFLKLKMLLTGTGEMISVVPMIDSERADKIKFRMLYARAAQTGLPAELVTFSGVTVSELLKQRADSLVEVMERAVRAGQAAAAALGKEIDFEVVGDDLTIEGSLCDAIAVPLLHLVRNAVGHGIEPTPEREQLGKPLRGKIKIIALKSSEAFRVTVVDDGRGIDARARDLLFRPGFSTASEASKISGRGVGLDAVKTDIEAAGGDVKVTSRQNEGSSFQLTLPTT